MTNLNDYVTETEAAEMVGVSAGKGNVWRHLRQQAPNIKLEVIFGVTAVKRSTLLAYCQERESKQIDAFADRVEQAVYTRLKKKAKSVDAFTHEKRRAQLRRLREMCQNQKGGTDELSNNNHR